MRDGKVLKILAIVVWILGFIGGIFYGGLFFLELTTPFSWTIAITVWCSITISCGLIYGIGTIIEHLNNLSHYLTQTQTQPNMLPAADTGWQCPKCNIFNPRHKAYCSECNTVKP